MAIGIYFAPTGMSAARYDECIKKLNKAGAAHPKGRSYHASFGPADKVMVFDVWDSMETFNKFGETLMPILQDLGVDVGQPDIMPVHNIIVPPAATPKAAKAKAAKPARKVARKPARASAKAKKTARRGRK